MNDYKWFKLYTLCALTVLNIALFVGCVVLGHMWMAAWEVFGMGACAGLWFQYKGELWRWGN